MIVIEQMQEGLYHIHDGSGILIQCDLLDAEEYAEFLKEQRTKFEWRYLEDRTKEQKRQ